MDISNFNSYGCLRKYQPQKVIVNTGVSQEIIHEPYIEFLFVKNINTCISHLQLKLFADNTCLISVDENRDNFEHLVLHFLMVS